MVEPAIVVAEDDAHLAQALVETLNDAGHRVLRAGDGHEALALAMAHDVQLVLSDVHMPNMDGTSLLEALRESCPGVPVILMTAYATIDKAVDAMRRGADSYLVKPFQNTALLSTVEECLSRHRTLVVNSVETGAVVCGDEITMALLSMAGRVATSDVTVMLTGESGTGKEVFARFIHNNSARADAPFVAVNCAAIPETLLEATLFGYQKGAFTGATQATPGKFEQAQNGTLLLDEITEMPLPLQAKLLRVLQEREVERVGGKSSIELDVRVLATSNRNLAEAVSNGDFREDLYYRLNVFPLHIPPLRERRGDVMPLTAHLFKHYCRGQRAVPKLTPLAEKRLLQHSWPGNVRELENLVQRTLVLLEGSDISEADLVFEADQVSTAQVDPLGEAIQSNVLDSCDTHHQPLHADLRIEERRLIIDALRSADGNRESAARKLDISPRTLRYKIARLRESGFAVPEQLLQSRRKSTSNRAGAGART
ncbi:MAG: sigma-54 dependent transcriptional regulator [Pseudomonadota bacterium]